MDAPCPKREESVIDNLPPTYIDKSDIHGFGLFAACPLQRGRILGTLDGQVMSWDHYHALRTALSLPSKAQDYLFFEWNSLSPDTLLVRAFRTKYSYINHARQPNVELQSYPLQVIALRDIAQGEELLLDYRKEPLNEEYLTGHGSTYL